MLIGKMSFDMYLKTDLPHKNISCPTNPETGTEKFFISYIKYG
jgi:hypothetical protein